MNYDTQNVLHVSSVTLDVRVFGVSTGSTSGTWVRPGAAPLGGAGPEFSMYYRPVVKLQDSPLSGFPPASLMLVEIVAVYLVLAANVTFGFSVATRVVAL